MAQRKSYFLAPNCDNPPDGPIRLGNILTSPFKPEYSLISPRLSPSIPIYSTTVNNFSADLTASSNFKIGLYAKFLETITGVGADVGISRENSTRNIYKISRVATRFFIPTAEFVQSVMADQTIREFLVKKRFQKNVYMVTGVKIAYGGDVTLSRTKDRGQTLKVGIDGTALMAPFNAGPDINHSKRSDEVLRFESVDFVFAYRLTEIIYKKKEVKSKPYESGVLLGLERSFKSIKKEDEEVTQEDIEVTGISEGDVSAENIDIDGEVCTFKAKPLTFNF